MQQLNLLILYFFTLHTVGKDTAHVKKKELLGRQAGPIGAMDPFNQDKSYGLQVFDVIYTVDTMNFG